jgi:hypothetical protein
VEGSDSVLIYACLVWNEMERRAPELEYSSNMMNHPTPKNPPNRAAPFSCALPPPVASLTRVSG